MSHAILELASLGVALGVAVAVALLAAASRRHPWVVLGPLTAIIVFTPQTGGTSVSLHGYAITPVDAVGVVAAVSAAAGFSNLRRNLMGAGWPLLVFLLMTALSLGLGLRRYETGAVLDAQTYLMVVFIGAYAASLPRAQASRIIQRWLRLTALALSFLAVYNIARHGLGDASTGYYAPNGSFISSRPLDGEQAVVVAAAFLFEARRWSGSRRGLLPLTAFTIAIVISQQRTVWIALICALAVLAPLVSIKYTARALVGAAGVAAMGLLVLAATSSADRFESDLKTSISSVSLTSGTGGDRADTSRVLISQAFHEGAPTVILGSPFGSGYAREAEANRLENFNPHNAYTQTFLRTGLIGLLAVVGLLGAMLRPGVRAFGRLQPALVTLIAVFSLGYPFPLELAPVIGALLVREPSLDGRPRDRPEIAVDDCRPDRQDGIELPAGSDRARHGGVDEKPPVRVPSVGSKAAQGRSAFE